MVAYRDCLDCGGTGRIGRADCYLCHGTGQCREDTYDDEVADAILAAPDDVVVAGGLDGLAEGTHYIDRTGTIRPKATQ